MNKHDGPTLEEVALARLLVVNAGMVLFRTLQRCSVLRAPGAGRAERDTLTS